MFYNRFGELHLLTFASMNTCTIEHFSESLLEPVSTVFPVRSLESAIAVISP